MRLNKKAFTLIELIVVMAIIAVLVLLAAPRFLGYTKDANVTAAIQDAKVLSDAAEIYHLENESWPVIKDAQPLPVSVGGADELYPIDSSRVQSSVKKIRGDYKNYGIAISGKHEGQVFSLGDDIEFGEFKEYGLFGRDDIRTFDGPEVEYLSNNVIKLSTNPNRRVSGLYITQGDGMDLTPDTEYALSFSYQKTEGELNNIGGHARADLISDRISYLDGEVNRIGNFGVDTPNDNDEHSILIKFKTSKEINMNGDYSDRSIWIQPNRLEYNPVTILIKDLKLIELVEPL